MKRVIWIPSVQRALVFLRYSTMIAYWLARGPPLLQEFKDVVQYKSDGNYSQTPEEKKAEAEIMQRYRNDNAIKFLVLVKKTWYIALYGLSQKRLPMTGVS